MMKARSKRLWLLGLAVACLACLGIRYAFRDTTRIYGQLSHRDIAEIKTIVHRQVFNCPRTPAWLPSVFEPLLWAPLQRLISDVRHPIDVISLRSDGAVVVVYGGPEQKAYLNFKEHGYFPKQMVLRKGPDGWLTKGPGGAQQILVFP